jgi:hypothetical protein
MVYIKSNTATERVHAIALDSTRVAVTGATLVLRMWRSSDGYFLDFSDSTFKAAGHGSITIAMTEHSASNNAGVYYADIPISSITNPTADDVYSYRIDQTAGATTAANLPALGEVRVGRWVDTITTNLDTTMSSRATNAGAASSVWGTSVPGAFGSGTAGFNLDAAVSTRSAPGDAMTLSSNALNAAALAADAVAEIQSGLATLVEVSNVPSNVWGTALPGAFGAGTAGAHLDVAVSTRAVAGDAMTLAADAMNASALAADAVAEIQSGLATAVALASVASDVQATPGAVWDVATGDHASVGTFGLFLSVRLDVATSTRAVPGDAMSLVADAVTANSVATSAVTEIQNGLATAAALATVATNVQATPAAVWNVAQSGYSSDTTTFGWALRALRIIATNRIAEAPGTPGTLIVYADDATSAFITYNLNDFNGNGVLGMIGAPARRAAGTVTPP